MRNGMPYSGDMESIHRRLSSLSSNSSHPKNGRNGEYNRKSRVRVVISKQIQNRKHEYFKQKWILVQCMITRKLALEAKIVVIFNPH